VPSYGKTVHVYLYVYFLSWYKPRLLVLRTHGVFMYACVCVCVCDYKYWLLVLGRQGVLKIMCIV
jgi:hypothetical protein